MLRVLHSVGRVTAAFVLLGLLAGCGELPPPSAPLLDGARGDDVGQRALSIRGEEQDDGRTVLVVENRGSEALAFLFSAEIEALEIHWSVPWDDEAPQTSEYSIEPNFFFLTEDCSEPISHGRAADRCVSVRPGETLRTVPWTGLNAAIQCPRRTPSDFPSPEGLYRFVLTSCDRTMSFEGEPFLHTSRAARTADYD